jgi:Helix-turn-helix domain
MVGDREVSFPAIRWAWSVPDLTAIQRYTLITICDIAVKHGELYPSQAYIAAMTGLTDRAIRSYLKAFESRGLISRKAQFKADGSRTSDLFTIHCPELKVAASSKGEGHSISAQAVAPPERHSLPPRNDVPIPPGMSFQDSNHDEPTRSEPSDIDRVIEFEFELFPEPNGSSDLHNRAKRVLDELHSTLADHLDLTSPGIQNTAILKQWMKLYDHAFLVSQIRLIAGRKARNGPLIRSWRYFAKAIEQAAKEQPGIILDRKESAERD